MKQILVLLFAAILLIPGCQKREGITPPNIQSGVMISSTEDGLGVTISWDMIGDADGYAVVTPCHDTISMGYNNSFTDEQPTVTGTYHIYSIHGPTMSKLYSISDAPFKDDSTAFVCVLGSDEGPSGFGWNTTTGIGTSYDCLPEHRENIDFFLQEIQFPLYFVSADEAPYYGNKTTGIQIMGQEDFFAAPESNYNSHEMVSIECYYAFRVEGNYYAKVFAAIEGCHTIIIFTYEFQTIQGLRIF